MPGFVKPTRKVVNIKDAFGELIGKKLIKDLHDNEEICPVCHGIGLRIEDNPYGLSDDPDKRAGQFPYKHQSIRFCPNCYMGEPTWNPAVLDFTESRLDDLVKECGLHAVTIHPVVSTMMPRSNNDLSSYLKHWCEIKNTQRHGEAGLQLSINSTSDDQREAQFAGKSLSLREIANIASDLPMPVGRKYTLNFAVTEATILDAKVLDSLFDRDKFIVKITPIHQTKAALEHNYDITTSYDDYSVYDKFEQPLLDLGWDVIVFVPSKEEDSDRITCGNALISEV